MAKRRKKRNQSGTPVVGNDGANAGRIDYVSISQETRRRYLNYALSVITSRALPDVRDGLKPVQRRIMYVMFNDLRLLSTAKPRKSLKICGDTTGNYHPHGDQSVYDTLVRMAQDFTLRNPLIIGQGNFGSIMGLPPAAARYTEARLSPIAEELMVELRDRTVDMRPNYEATRDEPVVLPARFPNLLVNGAQGIAVGMATNIPPHNLGEVVRACVHLIRNPDASVAQLMKYIKGPDFPLGGRIVTDRRDLRQAYEDGRGPIKVRGEWGPDTLSNPGQGNRIVITTVPYGVDTGPLVAAIGDIVSGRKLPQLTDVIDETSDEHGLRIVLEMKPGADPEAVVAYLFKNTALEQNFGYNATCLVPDGHGGLVPQRCNLVEMIRHFLDFRFETLGRRLRHQLEQLEKRIHILEGFAILFDGLDRALKLIRNSQGKADAAEKLMAAYPLDKEQTDAILDLALYRISQLEMDKILAELDEKRKEANRIRGILASDRKMWKIIETELEDVSKQHADRRRTSIGSSEEIAEFDPQAYIVHENTNAVLSREGWIKRVGRLQSVEKCRVREGDAVLSVVPVTTLDQVVFFGSDGVAYSLPVEQIPATAGYGEPLSKHFKLGDGVTIVSAIGTDPRFTPEDEDVKGQPTPAPYIMVVTERGQVLRMSLSGYRTPSTRNGRKLCRLRKGDRVVFAEPCTSDQTIFIATRNARILHFSMEEVPVLAGPGMGVRGIRLEEGDAVLGAQLMARPSDCLRVVNTNGKLLTFGQQKYVVTSRGGKGQRTSLRNGFQEITLPEIELVDWGEVEEYDSDAE